MVDDGLAELDRIAADPRLRQVDFTIRGEVQRVSALRPDGLLTTPAIRRAAADGRMANIDAIARVFSSKGRGRRAGRSVEPYLAALADAVGAGRPMNSRTMTPQQALELAAREVYRIEADPRLATAPRERKKDAAPLNALTAGGLLTVAGVVRASGENRTPSVTTYRRLFPSKEAQSSKHRGRANSLRGFQEALAEYMGRRIDNWSTWTPEMMVEAGVALMHELRSRGESPMIDTTERPRRLLDDDGLPTSLAIADAGKRGLMPPIDQIAAKFAEPADDNPRSLKLFVDAIAKSAGVERKRSSVDGGRGADRGNDRNRPDHGRSCALAASCAKALDRR